MSLAMSTAITDALQPMPAMFTERMSLRILNMFTTIADSDGTVLKDVQCTISPSIWPRAQPTTLKLPCRPESQFFRPQWPNSPGLFERHNRRWKATNTEREAALKERGSNQEHFSGLYHSSSQPQQEGKFSFAQLGRWTLQSP